MPVLLRLLLKGIFGQLLYFGLGHLHLRDFFEPDRPSFLKEEPQNQQRMLGKEVFFEQTLVLGLHSCVGYNICSKGLCLLSSCSLEWDASNLLTIISNSGCGISLRSRMQCFQCLLRMLWTASTLSPPNVVENGGLLLNIKKFFISWRRCYDKHNKVVCLQYRAMWHLVREKGSFN